MLLDVIDPQAFSVRRNAARLQAGCSNFDKAPLETALAICRQRTSSLWERRQDYCKTLFAFPVRACSHERIYPLLLCLAVFHNGAIQGMTLIHIRPPHTAFVPIPTQRMHYVFLGSVGSCRDYSKIRHWCSEICYLSLLAHEVWRR